MFPMGESERERIIRLHARDLDPIAELLREVRAEAKATRELLEATKKSGNGNGNGNGKRLWNGAMKVLCTLVAAAIIGGFVWTRRIDDRTSRLEQIMPSTSTVNTIIGNQLVILQRLQELERWRYTVESRLP